jgi:hypothetical protein
LIFSAPRFVVVDDKETHLGAIIQAFQQLGSPCIGIHYDPAGELNRAHFRGVRCLFLDLHLIEGQAGTDQRRHYAVIASILEDNISQTGGPFILVIWTEHEHLSNELREYLDTQLDPAKPHARPLAVLGLAKEKFINTGDGTVNRPEELRAAVREALLSNSQLAALLGWEADVLIAAGDTLAALLSLVPVDQRTTSTFSGALDTILSRLARESVGRSNVDVNHRAAITNALAPILADRIINQDVSDETKELWKKAVTQHSNARLPEASPSEAGQINRMLHLAGPPGETIRPADWGAVVNWPFAWSDFELASRLGLNVGQLLGGEFHIERDDRLRCSPVLVRVGAVCDYAQNRTGPLTYLLGVEIPEEARRTPDSAGKPLRLAEAIWRSPVFITPGGTEASRLHVHIRLPLTVLANATATWGARYRLREQLLMSLIAATSSYIARPGIVALPVK